jgi:hypothetical protein
MTNVALWHKKMGDPDVKEKKTDQKTMEDIGKEMECKNSLRFLGSRSGFDDEQNLLEGQVVSNGKQLPRMKVMPPSSGSSRLLFNLLVLTFDYFKPNIVT